MASIAIFLSDLDGGGAERVMINLARGFAERGLDVDIVLVSLEGPYLSQLPSQVRVVHLGGRRLLLSLPALVSYLKRERPAVMLSALEDTNIVAISARWLAGISTRIVVTVHNTLSQESQNAPSLKRRFIPYLVQWFYPWASAVVSVSKGVAEDLVQLGVPLERIQVIYNPVVTSELFTKSQEPLEHPWFLSGQPPVILGIGRLEKQKDFPTLIRAFARVRKQQPARLMVLGEGKERLHLESLVQELELTEDVAFPGFVTNPYAYMAQAAVCVLSSAWEGFGNVLVEAMATGTPVVSTNCRSGPVEILKNGQYGRLVAVGDAEGMAEAIANTLAAPLLPGVLQQRAVEFSLEESLAQYLKVLRVS